MSTQPEDKCPVDHQTRQKWLDAARAQGEQDAPHPPHPPLQPRSPLPPTARELMRAENDARLLEKLTPRILQLPQEQRTLLLHQWQDLRAFNHQHQQGQSKFSLDSLRWTPTLNSPPKPHLTSQSGVAPPLSTAREISTIPRALPDPRDRPPNAAEAAASSSPSASMPANSERDTGHDPASGNWIYPSQSMFFAAMRRKGYSPTAADMQTIVPMHNAVNERAWSQILAWERRRGSDVNDSCGGPKLVSFEGDSKKLTPRARWWGLWGYAKPFDRHDWVVERCGGERVEYVIDFYEGAGGKAANGTSKVAAIPVSFYLDVRPKINTWEGLRMRMGV